MEFFVPTLDGSGKMSPEEAESAWTACRKGAEQDTGSEATGRRIYSVHFVRNGKSAEAIVGQPDPYYDRETVMAIIEAGAVYKICCARRGFLKIGDTPMVGISQARAVEFDGSDTQ